MIACDPVWLFSWNYQVKGSAAGETARIERRWFSEQGAIETPRARYQIVKQGIFSGTWHLERDETVVAVARKPNPLTRRFEITFAGQFAVLEAQSMFSRAMRLTTPNGAGGSIVPLHPFTRRATMDLPGIPFDIQCFALWLTVLMWRRAAKNNS